MAHCCSCGGGSTSNVEPTGAGPLATGGGGGCGWSAGTESDPYSPDKGYCMDTAGDATDSFGDNCGYYDIVPEDCDPAWNDGDFYVMAMCCACGGGHPIDEEVVDEEIV